MNERSQNATTSDYRLLGSVGNHFRVANKSDSHFEACHDVIISIPPVSPLNSVKLRGKSNSIRAASLLLSNFSFGSKIKRKKKKRERERAEKNVRKREKAKMQEREEKKKREEHYTRVESSNVSITRWNTSAHLKKGNTCRYI